jgi:hypothetical protein
MRVRKEGVSEIRGYHLAPPCAGTSEYLGAGQWTERENQALVAAGFALMHEEDDLWSKNGVLFGRKAALQSARQPLHPSTPDRSILR